MRTLQFALVASALFLVSCQNLKLPWKKEAAAADPYGANANAGYAYGQYPQQPAQPQAGYGQYPQQQYPQQPYANPGYGAEQPQVYPASGAGYAPPADTYDAPAPAASSGSGRAYTVKKGDTLFGISKKTGASVSRIMSTNGLTSDMIRVGQTLRIP